MYNIFYTKFMSSHGDCWQPMTNAKITGDDDFVHSIV